MLAAGGVEDQHVVAADAGARHGAPGDVERRLAEDDGKRRDLGLLAQDEEGNRLVTFAQARERALAPRLARRERSLREEMFLAGDGHWSSVGHRCAAEEVAPFLVSGTTIWRSVLERRR